MRAGLAIIGALLLASPSVLALCEAAGSGTCYYVDAVNGNDANAGTSEAQAWQTFAKMTWYYKGSYRPAGWVSLKPGDVVYLLDGTYSTVVKPGDGSSASGGAAAIANFRSVNNERLGSAQAPITVKAYPGANPVIGPNGGVGFNFEANRWWVVEGIEFNNSSGGCINVDGSEDLVFDRIHVHHCARGVTSGNPAGLKLDHARRTIVKNSVFHDTLEMPVVSLIRGVGIQLFAGEDITILNNTFYQTVTGTDASGKSYGPPICMFHKHAQDVPTGFFHVFNNTFTNCGGLAGAIGTSTQNSIVSGNIIYNSPSSLTSKDYGGPTYQVNQLWEYNTVYNSGPFIMDPDWGEANPTTPYPLKSVLDPPRNITFRRNIVYRGNARLATFDQYMTDAMVTRITGEIHFDENCYFTGANTPTFGIGENPGASYGPLGQTYTWQQWQAAGYDAHTVLGDPLFVDAGAADFRLQSGSPCSGMGAFAQGGPAPAPPPSKPGDRDGDGDVDASDILLIAVDLNKTSGFNPANDLNTDGKVDLFDLVIAARNWG